VEYQLTALGRVVDMDVRNCEELAPPLYDAQVLLIVDPAELLVLQPMELDRQTPL
jgi:hypothetical protein